MQLLVNEHPPILVMMDTRPWEIFLLHSAPAISFSGLVWFAFSFFFFFSTLLHLAL